jgi:hypothetical protein
MDLRRSKVIASTIIPGVGGKNIGPGQPVDLDEPVGGGQTVRDLFPEDWFEELEPASDTQVQARREPGLDHEA